MVFLVQKALIYYTVNKSHQNSFILLVFSHVANFRYVANFRFLTLHSLGVLIFWNIWELDYGSSNMCNFSIVFIICHLGGPFKSKTPFFFFFQNLCHFYISGDQRSNMRAKFLYYRLLGYYTSHILSIKCVETDYYNLASFFT